ncbi:MAG: type II secretion system protein [Candidatus Cryosericum sp.]
MVNHRRGFTLLELMVALGILIILLAIAIPSYFAMMNKARRSAVIDEFANLATVLQTFQTDWGRYPVAAAGPQVISSSSSGIYKELTTEGTGAALINVAGAKTVHGDDGPVVYIGAASLASMINPFVPSGSAFQYSYATNVAGTRWALYVRLGESTAAKYLVRTDHTSSVVESDAEPAP